MNKKDFNKFFDKAFGKEKDEVTHARAMLLIYFVFIVIIVLVLRLSNNSTPTNTNNNGVNKQNKVVEPTPTSIPKKVSSDINYSYSYKINYNGEGEIYLGKKIDDKEKFSHEKNGVVVEYAIKDDNYLIEENGIYHITDKINGFFKYCSPDKILSLLENKTIDSNTGLYSISNYEISNMFSDMIDDNGLPNTVKIEVENSQLKSITLDLSNYISSLYGNTSTLKIVMEFANVGTVEDFDIKMN